MNAAAALVAGDKAKTLKQGLKLAQEAVDKGQALAKLEQLIKLSQRFS
jgi:anthranilate phosphoribosyltransferase